MPTSQDIPDRSKMPDDTCYIDTDVGVDEPTADGSEAKPYKSLAYAYIQRYENPASKYLTRASKTGDDEAAKLAWKDPAKAAVKKAQSALAAHKKKLEKAAQVAAAEDKLKQQRLKNLEEGK